MTTTQANICVVGSSNIDLISKVPRLPVMGETMIGHSFHLGYGGKGANQAVMAAKLGARVKMVTKLGRDVFGDGTLKNYQNQGIDTTHVLFDDALFSGVAPIFVNDNVVELHRYCARRQYGLVANRRSAAGDVILEAGLLVCQLEIPIETTLEAFRVARSGSVITILNPAPAAALPDELLELTDICAPNETETEMLTGYPVGTLAEAQRAAHALLKRGPKVVILTLGERGVLVVTGDSVEHVPALHVDAVDPTGAGDAFIGSLATFLGEGLSLPAAVRRANAVAALSVTQIGTQVSFPSRAEADVFLLAQAIA